MKRKRLQPPASRSEERKHRSRKASGRPRVRSSGAGLEKTPRQAQRPLDLPETEAYTIQDTIDVSRVSKTKIYAEIKNGRLKSFLLCGRRLILREDLSAWLRAARDAE